MRMLLTKACLDFAANVSLVSLSHIHAQGCVHTDTQAHTHTHISMLAGAPFVSVCLILPSFCLQIGGQSQRGRAEGEESCEAKRLVT